MEKAVKRYRVNILIPEFKQFPGNRGQRYRKRASAIYEIICRVVRENLYHY